MEYEKSLEVDSTSKATQAPRKIQWTLKGMDEAVRNTKVEILGPLQMIQSLFISDGYQRIVDDLQIADILNSLRGLSSEVGEHAAVQKATLSRKMKILAAIQQSVARQQGETTVSLNEANTIAAYRSQEKEEISLILDMTRETVSTVKSIEERLQGLKLSDDVLIAYPRNEQLRLGSIQSNLQQLINESEAQATAGAVESSDIKNTKTLLRWCRGVQF